jgi:tetratricopeptide (TPR) repeat protein
VAAAVLLGAARAQTRDQAARTAKVLVKPSPTATPTPRAKRSAGTVLVKTPVSQVPIREVVKIRPGTAEVPPSKPPAAAERLGPSPSAKSPSARSQRSAGSQLVKTPVSRVPAKEAERIRPGTAEVPPSKPPAEADSVATGSATKFGSAELLRQGHYAQAQGDLAAAKRAFTEARDVAKTEKATGLEAQAALHYAQMIQSLDAAQLTSERVSEARTAYSEAIRLGTPKQRVQAQNDLAVLSLKRGDSRQAVATLREVDVQALEPEQRSLYTYNYGRALELNGNGPEAYQKYTQALEQDPGFDLATEGAFRLLRAFRPPRVGEAARLAETLLSRGQQKSAARELRRALEAWAAEPDAQRLLAVLLRYYAAARTDPSQFRRSEWPALRNLADRGPQLAPAIRQIATAYAGEVPVFVERGSARGFFNAWSPESWKSEPFSRLLKTIGDSYDRAEQPRQALALYSGAWSLDPTNTEAALYVALTLRDHAEGLDPGGRLLDRLTESVFEEKGIAYQQLDWVNILRQHVLLATIFEKQGRWGPRSNPRSAFFQWTNALRADDQVRQRDPGFPLSPGIYLHLGECQARVGDPGLAWNAFAKAANAFLKVSKPEEAAAALERARALVKYMTPQQLETVRSLEDAIARSRKSTG